MSHYKHLTQTQRYQIAVLLEAKHSLADIAELIGFHRSTVWREIKRNTGRYRYTPLQAQRLADDRKLDKSYRRIGKWLWKYVRRLLRFFQWSPQQISECLRQKRGFRISHEYIYRFIRADKQTGGDLYRHLRCKKKYRQRGSAAKKRNNIPDRVGIEERPGAVNERLRLGDWEADTVIGNSQRHVLVTSVERRSRLLRMALVERKQAAPVAQALIDLLKPLPIPTRTVTVDNGTEFTNHAALSSSLKAAVYFTNPYCSWEKGAIENMNGLLRQYFPKGSDFSRITQKDLDDVMNKLNNRPRKVLGYKTPNEVFFANLNDVALQS